MCFKFMESIYNSRHSRVEQVETKGEGEGRRVFLGGRDRKRKGGGGGAEGDIYFT